MSLSESTLVATISTCTEQQNRKMQTEVKQRCTIINQKTNTVMREREQKVDKTVDDEENVTVIGVSNTIVESRGRDVLNWKVEL